MAESKIWITDEEKLNLFQQLREVEEDKEEFKYLLSAEHLERICLGKTYLSDSAYSPLRAQLKREYKEWIKTL